MEENFHVFMKSFHSEELGRLESPKSFYQLPSPDKVRMINAFIWAGKSDELRSPPQNFKSKYIIDEISNSDELLSAIPAGPLKEWNKHDFRNTCKTVRQFYLDKKSTTGHYCREHVFANLDSMDQGKLKDLFSGDYSLFEIQREKRLVLISAMYHVGDLIDNVEFDLQEWDSIWEKEGTPLLKAPLREWNESTFRELINDLKKVIRIHFQANRKRKKQQTPSPTKKIKTEEDVESKRIHLEDAQTLFSKIKATQQMLTKQILEYGQVLEHLKNS
eukprot:TRINITY_DN11016_c0_g1_i1.p1 TRINITY_DN11016_c0_g1~~TRINITY_DN11016_c0_g1_i1.p1  ORF type:complete len:274 (-),score=68.35 TRINITY_DN11016_c0_g1_i1:46-867(-)